MFIVVVQLLLVFKEGDDCFDLMLVVKGLINVLQYYVGDQLKFIMVVINIGLVFCKCDVGVVVLVVYVYLLDNKWLWFNLDCVFLNEMLVKMFFFGEQVMIVVIWIGMGLVLCCLLLWLVIGLGIYNFVV